MLLAVVVLVVSAKDIAEPDIWWHLQNARHLLATHSFPSTDTYSFTAAGSPWLDHEWLSEIPFYLGFRAAGLQGLLLVYATVLILMFAGVYYRCCLAGAPAINAAAATLGAILLGEVSFGPRMLLFGWLCMVGLLIILDRFRQSGHGLWMLPPLFAIWINLHGSWVFGAAVLLLTFACGLIEGEWGRVEEVSLLFVVVRIWDLRRLIVPITYFIEKPFQNWTRASADLLGSVFLYTDYTVPLDALRKELDRILENAALWDRKTKVLQVTDAKESTLELRVLVSAADSSAAWDLRCYVREKLVDFLQRNYPQCLPRARAELRHIPNPTA